MTNEEDRRTRIVQGFERFKRGVTLGREHERHWKRKIDQHPHARIS